MWTSKIFVTVDAVVFRQAESGHELLLIKRLKDPDKGKWALPGGFVDENEDLPDAVKRELLEETGVVMAQIEQLGAFGKPGRDPRHHTVSVVYAGFVPGDTKATGADDAEDAKWFSVKDLPLLAFDHSDIVNLAIEKYKL